VGKINPDGSVEHFELPTVGAVPIYIAAGPDGNMWCTELVGNMIARITPKGEITELKIPTYNSRPIAIIPGPDGKSMWFSEEAGNKVARIDMDGKITEFGVPLTQSNVILAGLAFDSEGNLWTQSYVDPHNPAPEGPDHIVKLDKSISTSPAGDLSRVPVNYYEVPTRMTIMHRIIQGPDGNMWFTELGADKFGKVTVGKGK
jgi:virginiamycin B lyase